MLKRACQIVVLYLARLPNTRLTLWCYLVWYLSVVTLYFNASPEIWLNSLGISVVVGYALFLSTGPGTLERLKQRFWESLRLFMCPFLVSSFSSLVKGKGFVLLFSPLLSENLMAASLCVLFIVISKTAKLIVGNSETVCGH